MRKKKQTDKPTQIIIDTHKGISYYFDLKRKSIAVILKKELREFKKPGIDFSVKRLKQIVSLTVGGIGGMGIISYLHEGIHGATVILLGGKVENFDLEPSFNPKFSIDYIVSNEIDHAVVTITPRIFEAIVGLLLLQIGLKKKKPILFGLGAFSTGMSAVYSISEIIGTQKGDLTDFVSIAKNSILQYASEHSWNLGEPSLLNKLAMSNDQISILIIAALLHGTAYYGTKYVANINYEYLPLKMRKKVKAVLSEINEKDPKLYKAMTKNFFAKKARRYGKIIIEKLPKLKKALEK